MKYLEIKPETNAENHYKGKELKFKKCKVRKRRHENMEKEN